ncbi:AraC family transcriptional regulator [Burkholderia sp. HI2761]|uniref:GlxA family transcriptional regulator n=1 Tax=Burkholderia TaxID=32008 RepID=UPI0004248C57|nr:MULTISPECIES: helix-turn-helix domain-containing protein [Burkholderia]MPV55005.1 helix-turn-helix domain-containing protein [Burkholderia sp. BE24]OXJ21763.1 AraC family transcriptional regulator [Burkholderia sp. HI2761]
MRLTILALDGLFDTGLTVLLDTFAMANELAAAQGFAAPPFDVTVVGVRKRIRTAHGLSMLVEPASSVRHPDWVAVPAPGIREPERLIKTLERRDVRDAMAHLRAWHAGGIGVAAACIGTFLLAEAGLLDRREATTTWSLSPFFRQRYPTVDLNDSRMVVAADRLVTAGSAMGHLDLALWLMRQASPELATLVARFMLIDKRSSQAEYIIPDYLAHADPLVARFERWARENLSLGFSLQTAAAALAVGPRTLQRRTEAVLGKSPLAFFQDLRIERAQNLVSMGYDLETIASEVGYADSATLRALLRRRLGRGVRELRADNR